MARSTATDQCKSLIKSMQRRLYKHIHPDLIQVSTFKGPIDKHSHASSFDTSSLERWKKQNNESMQRLNQLISGCLDSSSSKIPQHRTEKKETSDLQFITKDGTPLSISLPNSSHTTRFMYQLTDSLMSACEKIQIPLEKEEMTLWRTLQQSESLEDPNLDSEIVHHRRQRQESVSLRKQVHSLLRSHFLYGDGRQDVSGNPFKLKSRKHHHF